MLYYLQKYSRTGKKVSHLHTPLRANIVELIYKYSNSNNHDMIYSVEWYDIHTYLLSVSTKQ